MLVTHLANYVQRGPQQHTFLYSSQFVNLMKKLLKHWLGKPLNNYYWLNAEKYTLIADNELHAIWARELNSTSKSSKKEKKMNDSLSERWYEIIAEQQTEIRDLSRRIYTTDITIFFSFLVAFIVYIATSFTRLGIEFLTANNRIYILLFIAGLILLVDIYLIVARAFHEQDMRAKHEVGILVGYKLPKGRMSIIRNKKRYHEIIKERKEKNLKDPKSKWNTDDHRYRYTS